MPASWLPRGTALAGPLDLRVDASGSPSAVGFDGALDLSGAALRLPGLDKPAGTPLVVQVRGQASSSGITFERAGVALGPVALWAHGDVRSRTELSLSFDTGAVPIEPVLLLLPGLRAAVPRDVGLHGTARAVGLVRRALGDDMANVRVTLDGANVRTPRTCAHGECELIRRRDQLAGPDVSRRKPRRNWSRGAHSGAR